MSARPDSEHLTVHCPTWGCDNNVDGPWRVLGSTLDNFYCALCDARMVVQYGWEEAS